MSTLCILHRHILICIYVCLCAYAQMYKTAGKIPQCVNVAIAINLYAKVYFAMFIVKLFNSWRMAVHLMLKVQK